LLPRVVVVVVVVVVCGGVAEVLGVQVFAYGAVVAGV
jgi:hypothetical protein